MVSPSWPGDRAADATDVSAALATDAATAAAAIGAAVVDGAVASVATLDESVANDPVAGCDLNHRRGAWLSVCRDGFARQLYFSPGSVAARMGNG